MLGDSPHSIYAITVTVHLILHWARHTLGWSRVAAQLRFHLIEKIARAKRLAEAFGWARRLRSRLIFATAHQ
jgi:hypothetical protein